MAPSTLGSISNPLLFCNKIFHQTLPDAIALAEVSMFGLTVTRLKANICHVNGTKHGSDLYIVGS